MRQPFTSEQLDALVAIIAIARQVSETGETPELTCGWKFGDPDQANYYNEQESLLYVQLRHDDPEVFDAAGGALAALRLFPFTVRLDVSRFIFIRKPDAGNA